MVWWRPGTCKIAFLKSYKSHEKSIENSEPKCHSFIILRDLTLPNFNSRTIEWINKIRYPCVGYSGRDNHEDISQLKTHMFDCDESGRYFYWFRRPRSGPAQRWRCVSTLWIPSDRLIRNLAACHTVTRRVPRRAIFVSLLSMEADT